MIIKTKKAEGAEEELSTMFGNPNYQIYEDFEYVLKFNNMSKKNDDAVKLLLNLPMILPKHHKHIKLEYEEKLDTVWSRLEIRVGQ